MSAPPSRPRASAAAEPSRERSACCGEGRLLWIAALLALAVYLGQVIAFGNAPQDDTFISLRYARNLVEGQGLVFNPGERVEGYTNCLWTLLLALPFALGIDPVLFTYGLGILSGALLVLAAAALARTLAPERPLAAGIAALLAAATPYLVAEAIMGLETALFAAFAGLALAAYLARPERALPSALALIAAALTRPEGLLVSGWVGLHDLASSARSPERRRPFLLRWALVLGAVGAHMLFRFLYYGDVVPNTFHAKVGGGWAAVLRGLEYAFGFVLASLPLALLGAYGLSRSSGARAARARARWILGLALAYTAYSIYVGGDFKPTYRFFALPALLFAALAGVGALRLGGLARRAPDALALGLGCVGAALLILPASTTRAFVRQRVQLYPLHLAIGAWLRDALPPGTWIATANAGAVPYESRLPTVDLVGLCDAHIARVPMPEMGSGTAGHEKSDPLYVLERRPKVVLFQAARLSPEPLTPDQIRHRLQWRAERDLWQEPRFQREYRLRSAHIGFAWFNYFERVPEASDG